MKALIFGIGGQDGYYIRELLEKKSFDVIGISRNEGTKGNINNFDFVRDLIIKIQPDLIFHLAANSTTRHSALIENHETISTGTLNILESVYQHSKHSKVFITGSGVQFKNNGLPIHETDEFEANSPYSIARIQSVYAARYYRNLGIKTYIGYLFHHESPYRKSNHLSKLTTDYIKNINQNSPKLEIGDLTVKKEWGFAGDIVNGIFTLINQDEIFESVIGTGIAYSIEEWLKLCFELRNLDYTKYVKLKEEPFNAEYKLLVSKPETIFKLGWKPEYSLKDLASLMMA
jgi:GDPmannose 4,6-dehydratase